MTKILLFCSLVFGCLQYVQAQTCTVNKSNVCSDGECKVTSTSKSWTEIKKDHLLRCDSKGCDKYPIAITKSGQFTNIQIPSTSYILKYDEQLNFVEVSSFSLGLIVHTGQCRN